jgi:hypothetical protein
VREQASLEDVRTAALTTHVDDEYARAGEEDPKIMLTTSRNPSTRLTAFAKELRLVFPNTTRLNRGAQVRGARSVPQRWSAPARTVLHAARRVESAPATRERGQPRAPRVFARTTHSS